MIVGLVISPMGVLVEMVGLVRRGIMVMDRRTTGFGACKSFAAFVVLLCPDVSCSFFID